MRKQIKVWGGRTLVLALLVVAGWQWGVPLYKQYFTTKKTEVYVPTTKVRQGKFVVSFQQTGALQAEQSVSVMSDMNGKVISLINDGTMVTAGTELAVLDTTDLERDVRDKTLSFKNTQADVERAEADFKLLQESNKTDLAQAQAEFDYQSNELELAKADLDKKKRLLEEKLVTGEQVLQAEGKVRSQQLTVSKQKSQLELKKKEIDLKESQKRADVKNAQFRSDVAKAALDDVNKKMASAVIKAPAGGLVVLAETWSGGDRHKLRVGDSVSPRQGLCTLPDLSTMRIISRVGETDAPRVNLGMRAIIRLEAIPNKLFHGRVKEISNLATEEQFWRGGTPGVKQFEVVISLDDNDPKIVKPGMTADVEFISEEVARATYVPIEAVIERAGKTYVFVKSASGYHRVPVKLGKQNDNFVCIASGVSSGQAVALRDPTREVPGQEPGAGKAAAPKAEKKQEVPVPGKS